MVMWSKDRGSLAPGKAQTTIEVKSKDSPLGRPDLPKSLAARNRQSNRLLLHGLKRCSNLLKEDKFFSSEFLKDCFAFDLRATQALETSPGVFRAQFCLGCHGGTGASWREVLTNSKVLRDKLHQDTCTCQKPAKPWVSDDNEYWEREADFEYYSWTLCTFIGEAVLAEFEIAHPLSDVQTLCWRAERLRQQMQNTTEKYWGEFIVNSLMMDVARLEASMVPGREDEHLLSIVRKTSHRGADVRLLSTQFLCEEEIVPYPALRWFWQGILSWPWQEEQHMCWKLRPF